MKLLTKATPNRVEKIDAILQLSEKIYKAL
jgi:hypothetical protein